MVMRAASTIGAVTARFSRKVPPKTATKSLPRPVNERMRREIRKMIDEHGGEAGGGQTRVAELLGVTQGALSAFLSDDRGAGGKLVYNLFGARPSLVAEMFPSTRKGIAGHVLRVSDSVPASYGARPNLKLAIVRAGGGWLSETIETLHRIARIWPPPPPPGE